MKPSAGNQPASYPEARVRRLVLALLMCVVLGALGGLLAATVYHPASVRASFTPPREPARDFSLRDQDRRTITLAQGRGRVIVLTFLYSTCRDLCPAQAADIVQAIGKLGRLAGGVLVYGVSVDPVGDTPARARAFLKKYGVYGGPVHFLVGSRAALRPVWRTYGIVPLNATPEEAREAAIAYDHLRPSDGTTRPYRPPEPTAPAAAQQSFPDTTDLRYRGRARHHAGVDFEHSAYVMLIDKRGIQRVGIPFEALTPDSLAADLKRLLTEH